MKRKNHWKLSVIAKYLSNMCFIVLLWSCDAIWWQIWAPKVQHERKVGVAAMKGINRVRE